MGIQKHFFTSSDYFIFSAYISTVVVDYYDFHLSGPHILLRIKSKVQLNESFYRRQKPWESQDQFSQAGIQGHKAECSCLDNDMTFILTFLCI